jgi:hypothetical protein
MGQYKIDPHWHLKCVEILTNTDIVDVSFLACVKKLTLHRCNGVKEVSCLGNVNDLAITACRVNDVSGLINVKILDLSFCYDVIDVTNCAACFKLNLGHCYNMTDVSMLDGLNSLNLAHCRYINDVSMLGRLHTLILESCDGIVDVSALGNVSNLNLFSCDGVTDFSMLGNVKILNVGGCLGLKTLRGLNTIDTLLIPFADQIRDFVPIKGVRRVFLADDRVDEDEWDTTKFMSVKECWDTFSIDMLSGIYFW